MALFVGLGRHQLESSAREGGDVDYRAECDRPCGEINGSFGLWKLDGNGDSGSDNDLAIFHVQGAALEGAWRAEDRRNEPPAAGNGVNLPGFGTNAGIDELANGAGVRPGCLKVHLIVCIGRLKDDDGVLCFDDLSAGEKSVRHAGKCNCKRWACHAARSSEDFPMSCEAHGGRLNSREIPVGDGESHETRHSDIAADRRDFMGLPGRAGG